MWDIDRWIAMMTMKRSTNTKPSNIERFKKDLKDLRTGVIRQRKQEEERNVDKRRTQSGQRGYSSQSQGQNGQIEPNGKGNGEGGGFMVVYKIAQPPAFDDCLSYEDYKKRLELWESSADPPMKRMTSRVIE